MSMGSLTVFALVSTILAPCLARNVELDTLAPKQLTAALKQETYLAVFWRELNIPSFGLGFYIQFSFKAEEKSVGAFS